MMDIPRAVRVTTSARLHMGFFDLNGGMGRRFGSIGLALDHPELQLVAYPDARMSAKGADASRVLQYAQIFSDRLVLPEGARFEVSQSIPGHAGLGSGTQIGLATGMALSTMYHAGLALQEVAQLLGRGKRSGIGIGAFSQGGVLVDGGKPETPSGVESVLPPPLLVHMDFPSHWPVVLVLDKARVGVYGDQELSAFRQLAPASAAKSAEICRRILMQALPAIAEQEFVPFAEAMQELQNYCGNYFAPAQNGKQFVSPGVAKVLSQFHDAGVACYGQSSWGPTGFAIMDDEQEMQSLTQWTQSQLGETSDISLLLCHARNSGASISII